MCSFAVMSVKKCTKR